MACVPLHAPLAVHDVALVDDHVSVALDPTMIGLGETEIVTVGAAGAFTVSVAEALPLPPFPVQVSVYVSVPAAVGVSDCVPLVVCVPLHAPLAVHDVALVDDQVRVALVPRAMEVEFRAKVTVGLGLPPPPPQPAMMPPSAAHPSSSHRPRGIFPDQELWFPAPADLPRAGEAIFLPVTCASINAFLLPQRALLSSEETH
jgi:uncharacterized protein (UPF0212 family)